MDDAIEPERPEDRDPATSSGPAMRITDARVRVEGVARDALARSAGAVGQARQTAGDTTDRTRAQLDRVQARVRQELGRAVQETRSRSVAARDAGWERIGDVRGRVQPVVEQLQSQSQRVVDAGRDRARAVTGRKDTTT